LTPGGFCPRRRELPGHVLPLQEERRIRATTADGLQLRQKRRPEQGKGIVPLHGSELVQQPDAVAIAAAENGFGFVPPEPFKLFGLPDDFLDGVEAFKPVGVSGHLIVFEIAQLTVTGALSPLPASLHDVAKFCHLIHSDVFQKPLSTTDKGRYHG
jgi:hypothetical protein